jgi:hypothetical protein
MSTCNAWLLEMSVFISSNAECCIRWVAASQDEAVPTYTSRGEPMPKNQCLSLQQLQIVTLGFITSVHVPVCREQLGSHWMEVYTILYWGFLLNSVNQSQIWLKLDTVTFYMKTYLSFSGFCAVCNINT